MKRLIQGVHQFQNGAFKKRRDLYLKLGKSQSPHTLFITCSDSRVVPNMVTQSEPGEIFVVRNAGNIIPAFEEGITGEGASIEYAVRVLKVQDIVVCGHSGCGAVQTLLNPQSAEGLFLVPGWLRFAERTAEIMSTQYKDIPAEDRLNIAIQENVLVQLGHLRNFPFIREGIEEGRLNMHGWVYKIPTGEVFQYDYVEQQFLPLKGSAAEHSELSPLAQVNR